MRRFKNEHLYCRSCGQVRYNPVHLLFYAWENLLNLVSDHNFSHRVWTFVFVHSFTVDRWTHGIVVYEPEPDYLWNAMEPIDFLVDADDPNVMQAYEIHERGHIALYEDEL